MTTLSVRTFLARVGGAASLALVVYIGYAHVAEWRTSSEYLEDPIAIRFGNPEALHAFDVRREGDLETSVAANALHVRRNSANSEYPGSLEVLGPARRLREAELRLRFRLPRATSVDVGVAFVRADGVRARVGFGVNGDEERPSYRFTGDERADFPRAGDEFGVQRVVPFERPLEEHEITLRVSPDLHAILGSVDGESASSHLAGWDDGILVRPALFIHARPSSEPVDLSIFQMDYVPIHRDTRRRTFEERFDGQVLDPAFWRVLLADGWFSDGSARLAPGKGLKLEGHARRRTREIDVVGLVGPSQELGSFRATMHFSTSRLRHARLYFGISNLLFGLTDWRTFEIGLTGGAIQYEPFAAGHWEGDQQFVVTQLTSSPVDSAIGELTIAYDAGERTAVGALNGRVVTRQRLDLQPPEEARLQLGVRAIDEEADFDVTVHDVRFEAFPWALREASEVGGRPEDAGVRAFSDAFKDPGSLSRYRLLEGSIHLGESGAGLLVGRGRGVPATAQEVVRGFFDAPVSVTACIEVPPKLLAGADDSAGVMALDREGKTSYLAALWYGRSLSPSLHLTTSTTRGGEALATADAPVAPGRRYFVKMLIDRRNVYARYWLDDLKVTEPTTWMVTAPIAEGWTATGGVGITAHAEEVNVASLEAKEVNAP